MGNDKIFAHFITMYFPAGLKGLMVAGVLAATMSTLDSSINALSACFYNDIFHHRTKDAKKITNFYRRDTLFITFLFMAVAFIASKSDGLLLLGLKITSWTAGSLVALFFATLIFKFIKLSFPNVIFAYIFGTLGVYANTFWLKWDWNFNVYFGFIFALSALFVKKVVKP